MIGEVSDEALLSGDRESIGLLFSRHARTVMAIANAILRNRQEAEDVVSEVFIAAMNKASMFDASKGSVGAWLGTIAHRKALDRLSYLERRSFYDASEGREIGGESTAAEQAYWHSRLKAALGELTPDQRNVLQLHFFWGLTMAEISQYAGISRMNARNYYYRGLEQLRKAWKAEAGREA